MSPSVVDTGAHLGVGNMSVRNPDGCLVGCPILLKILQTFLSKKYVIPIYEMFGFLSFQSFPASSRVSPVTAKNTKDFQNL